MNICPALCARILEVLLDVLEGKVDLALEVVLVNVALVIPAALARALDGVADADGLRVGVFLVVGLANAFIVVVGEMRHGGEWRLEGHASAELIMKIFCGETYDVELDELVIVYDQNLIELIDR